MFSYIVLWAIQNFPTDSRNFARKNVVFWFENCVFEMIFSHGRFLYNFLRFELHGMHTSSVRSMTLEVENIFRFVGRGKSLCDFFTTLEFFAEEGLVIGGVFLTGMVSEIAFFSRIQPYEKSFRQHHFLGAFIGQQYLTALMSERTKMSFGVYSQYRFSSVCTSSRFIGARCSL